MRRLITTRLFEEEQKLADYDKLASDYKELQNEHEDLKREYDDYRDKFKDCYQEMCEKIESREEYISVLEQELEIRCKNDVSRNKMNNAVEIVSW